MLDKLLKSLGVDSKHITEINKAIKDGKEDEFDIAPVVDDFKANQRKLMENDEDLVKEIAGKEKGKLLDIYTRKIKQEFGLDSSLIKDKAFEDVIKIAKAESNKGLDKDLQTLQKENVELTNKVKDFEEVQIPQIKSEVEKEKKAIAINNKLQKKIPVADLRVPQDTVDLVLNSKLNAIYDIDLDEKGEPVLYIKGSKLQAKSSDGTKLLTIDDAIGSILKENKFIKESNADDIDPNTGKKKEVKIEAPDPANGREGKNKIVSPHLEKAIKHKEELAKINATT
jgi:hypothetical protein